MFASVGMGAQAVSAYVKSNHVPAAIQTCVTLNHWHDAVGKTQHPQIIKLQYKLYPIQIVLQSFAYNLLFVRFIFIVVFSLLFKLFFCWFHNEFLFSLLFFFDSLLEVNIYHFCRFPLELAKKYNQPNQISSLLAKYAQHLLDEDKTFQVGAHKKLFGSP